jgi:hypothetical protein
MTFEEINAKAQELFKRDQGEGWHAVDETVRSHYRRLAIKTRG